eukprot:6479713-Amphidinium_carterae.1
MMQKRRSKQSFGNSSCWSSRGESVHADGHRARPTASAEVATQLARHGEDSGKGAAESRRLGRFQHRPSRPATESSIQARPSAPTWAIDTRGVPTSLKPLVA